ncbi:unnamed protein product, partial [Aureobasidium pullulans]
MPTTIKLTDRQTELLRAFFEYDGTVKASPAALTPVQSDGSTTTKYNKTCQACAKLQVHCEKTAGSRICSRCREKDIPCELMPRKEYSSVNRSKRK